MENINIHKEKKKSTKNINNVLKYTYIVSFYFASIYVLEYQFCLSLFEKIAILYGIISFLKWINDKR